MRRVKATPFRSTLTSLRKKWWMRLAAGYLILLAVSHIVRLQHPDPWPLPESLHTISLPDNASEPHPAGAAVMRYIDTWPDAPQEVPVVLLVHGSPVAASTAFPKLAGRIGGVGRVLAPDLPGFGFSTRKIENYGFVAHANHLQKFLDQLNIKRVHVVAYSMGGGAAIHMAVDQPERIASLTLVSSIGVQELELLGDYHLNHALHSLQLVALWSLQELTPHMGLLDHFALNTQYARNFYDADQRPLRGLLRRIAQPTLILHGEGDNFVPLSAAKEHARLLPQSMLKVLDGGHLLVFKQTAAVAKIISGYIRDVEDGRGVSRAEADAARIKDARAPFGRLQLPSVSGLQLLVLVVLIALATLVSEDLACIGAGLMAARGILGFLPATAAAFVGIVVGDLMLYGAGRLIGRPALRRAPVRWFIDDDDVSRATRWLDDKGPGLIFASRFLPGSRLPVYFTSGVLGSGIWSFLFYFCIAAAVWTPGLVGVSMWAGEAVLAYYATFHKYALWVVLSTMLGLWAVLRFCVPLLSFKGRRLLVSRYKRLRHWQNWPSWLLYIPIAAYILYLGIRHRHLTSFTAANPAMPAGRFIDGSKSEVLKNLTISCRVSPFTLVKHNWTVENRKMQVLKFIGNNNIQFPLVCSPDVAGWKKEVRMLRSENELHKYLESSRTDILVQQYVQGKTFSVFYYRYPGQKNGEIISIAERRPLTVIGDGHTTLERLILMDPVAVVQAPLHLKLNLHLLHDIPKDGERIQLESTSPFCRGALLRDAGRLIMPALTRSFDDISRHFPGCYFGRYDVWTENEDAFKDGDDFTIFDLNDAVPQISQVFVSDNSLRNALKSLMRHWQIAFHIGNSNRQRGASTLPPLKLLQMVLSRSTKMQPKAGTQHTRRR